MVVFFSHLTEPNSLLGVTLGRLGGWTYVALVLLVFVETFPLFAPFLPSDALLFASGTLAGAALLNPWLASLAIVAASVGGDTANYMIGRYFGIYLVGRYPRLIPARYLKASRAYLDQYGGRTVLLARFIPVVRSLVPITAGMSRMRFFKFWAFNVAGAVTWVVVFFGAGSSFGHIPWVQRNLVTAVMIVVIASLVPVVARVAREVLRARKERVSR